MIKNVYIRTRPGADTRISESMMIAVGDAIRDMGLYVLMQKDEITTDTLVLALGGDGTMLSAIHIASDSGAYVAGFNYGNLGYLVPSKVRNVKELVQELYTLILDINRNKPGFDNEYKVTNYRLPLLTWDKKGKRTKQVAVNDFYFVPSANGSAADFRVTIGSEESNFKTKSSGMVVSTPFGSTGLALSAGGSILSPNSGVLEVVPMLPHTLTSRPIIVPDTDTIVVSWDRKVDVFADGRQIDSFGEGSVVLNCKKRKINLIQPISWDFFENLKNKMRWHS